MELVIYLTGCVICYIIVRYIQKDNCCDHNWKYIIVAILFSFLSWSIVITYSIMFIIVKLQDLDRWYDDKHKKLRKPPKWL